MQVKMLVGADVIERETGRAKGLELGADLSQHLPAHAGQKEHRRAGERHVRSKSPITIHKVRHGGGRQDWPRVRQREMQPDREPGQPPRHFHSRRRRGCSNHEARGRERAFDMGDLNRAVHLIGEAEIVRGDDQKLQCAVSRRSRKKRKNSAPSRSRRFIMSGLRTISPTIEAILPERK
jgi:hypothetical protein